MIIELKGREIGLEKSKKLWAEWYHQHHYEGKSIAQIARENINSRTKKPYTAGAIYYGFSRLKQL